MRELPEQLAETLDGLVEQRHEGRIGLNVGHGILLGHPRVAVIWR